MIMQSQRKNYSRKQRHLRARNIYDFATNIVNWKRACNLSTTATAPFAITLTRVGISHEKLTPGAIVRNIRNVALCAIQLFKKNYFWLTRGYIDTKLYCAILLLNHLFTSVLYQQSTRPKLSCFANCQTHEVSIAEQKSGQGEPNPLETNFSQL